MQQNPFLSEVLQECRNLMSRYRFRVTQEKFYSNAFGDGMVEMESDIFRLMIVRDRGNILISISSSAPPLRWQVLERVLSVITNTHFEEKKRNLKEAVHLLEGHADVLCDSFSGTEYEAMIKKVEELNSAAGDELDGSTLIKR